MNVITPGFEYEIPTTDTTTYPSGLINIKFANSITLDPGVETSVEIILMMLDRYLYLAEYGLDGSETCSINYRLAAKAELIVQRYVEEEEGTI